MMQRQISRLSVRRLAGVLLFAMLCRGSDASWYNMSAVCENPLGNLMTSNTSTYTTVTEVTIADTTVSETRVVRITTHNATEVTMLWHYFSHDLVNVDPTVASTLHNDATAHFMCAKSASLSALKHVLESIITDCGYEVLFSGAHIFQALYRIDTECSMNATNHYCVTPKNFFSRPYSNTDVQVETQAPEEGTTIVTTVTALTKHPMTWGTADLMIRACPDTCPVSLSQKCSDDDLYPPPPVTDCCMKVMWDFGKMYLGLGPSATCPMFRNLGGECLFEPSVAETINTAAGGAVEQRSGAGVSIPAGAIDPVQCANPCLISVSSVTPSATSMVLSALKKSNPLWVRVKLQLQMLDLGPDGLKFSIPVTTCLKLATGVNITNVTADVKIFQINLTDGSVIGEQIKPESYDETKRLVCFLTSHFSSYGGFDYDELGDGEDKSDGNDYLVQYVLGGVFGTIGASLCLFLCWYTARTRSLDNSDTKSRSSRTSSRPYSPNSVEMEFIPVPYSPAFGAGYVSAQMPYPNGGSPMLGNAPIFQNNAYASNPFASGYPRTTLGAQPATPEYTSGHI